VLAVADVVEVSVKEEKAEADRRTFFAAQEEKLRR
jgi:hypothetical protein